MNSCPHCNQKHAAVNHFCPVTGLPIALGQRLLSTKLLDKYTVLRIIGEGPIGIVLEVEDNISRQHYAAKLIHPRFSRDAAAAKAFIDDVVRVQSLSSENIAKIVQVGRDAGAAIVVIRELLIGESLASRISKTGRFVPKDAAAVAREILLALNTIHQSAIINLDLSPADIFLEATPNGPRLKMVDIGERHIKQAIPTGEIKPVSYNYYAPEQLDRSRQPNLRSDIYAAGMILYEMLTGKVPDGTPAPPESIRPEIPLELARITMQAIAPTPNNRFQSVVEFIHALDSIPWNAPQPAVQKPLAAPKTPAQGIAPTPFPKPAISTGNTDKQAALETASVIVEMPEIEKSARLKWIAACILLLVGGAAVWYFAFGGRQTLRGDAPNIPTVEIKIDVSPPDAAVYADGIRISGTPPVLTVPMDTRLHTISGKADGFESIERDVSFDRPKTVKLELMEIIQPDDPAPQDIQGFPSVSPAGTANPLPENTQDKPSVADDSEPVQTSTAVKSTKKSAVHTEKESQEKSKKPKKSAAEKTQKSEKSKTPGSSTKSKNVEGFRTTNPFE